MVKIDCLGDMCPVPVMRLKTVIDSIKKGEECMLVTDHSCTSSNIEAFCKANNLSYTTEEVINGVWEVTVFANK
ncbi:sulfurtransferase TusA family protein [Lacrimispora sp. BS-2]|uniref:Sulfurtransferase TusA family protein n=1 Tax=Lacrimispora sp. BS-2 TaxID=3151850 RepID=A0AAU7PUK4_9FIRM